MCLWAEGVHRKNPGGLDSTCLGPPHTDINQHFVLSCLGSSQVGQEESSGQFYHSVSGLSENQASAKENAENILVATILKINPPNYLIFSS